MNRPPQIEALRLRETYNILGFQKNYSDMLGSHQEKERLFASYVHDIAEELGLDKEKKTEFVRTAIPRLDWALEFE